MAESTQASISHVIDGAGKHLEELGYAQETVKRYDRTWRKLVEFATERGVGALSAGLAAEFMERFGSGSSAPAASMSSQRHLSTSMRILLEFHQHGRFRCRSSGGPRSVPGSLSPVLERYLRFCTNELRIGARTMRGRRRHVEEFLMFLASRGSPDVHSIGIETVSGFMTSLCHLKPRTLALVACNLRSFLRYLAMEGVLLASVVDAVPRVRACQGNRLPDVWRKEDVAALLAAVDRGSPVGKRDYVILLLAARLGMRVGDIRELKLEELRWDEARIERIQAKTGRPVVLPLTEEIGEALIAYLRDGRPPTQKREVFLRLCAPFEPFGRNDNLHHIITRYRRQAGIELTARSRKGLHSLRHTVATRLLEAGVSLETIAGVMGHISPETTRIYTNVDLAALRSAALEVEEVHHA